MWYNETMTKEELWQALLAKIQFDISQANFATWFKNTEIIGKKEGEVVVSVPNNFSKEWLLNKYNKTILKILHEIDQSIKEVKYEVVHSSIKEKAETTTRNRIEQLDFPQFKVNRETNLNPRYTFDNFIVGSFNELSHAASQAISKNPGSTYNPLFIYGGVGLGKTHLLQAIGNEIVKNFPSKKIKYISSEKFTSEVVSSIRNQTMEKLKSNYRIVDALIIDDIQFIAGKEKTQEEFFHTFNALYEKNKQIVISSDRPPNAISSLEERLCSRFEGGMITDISLPDFETRIAILKTKAQEKRINIASDVLEYIALNIKRNIRELEGALNQVAVYQKVNNCDVDVEKIKVLLKNVISSPYKKITSKKIIKCVADFYDLKESEVLQFSRKKEIVRPRQIAMFFLRRELKSSFPFIGRRFAGRDHTTAIYAYEKISKEIEMDNKFKEEIDLIKQLISKN